MRLSIATKRILRTNLHFVWVILFFIIHGYSQFHALVPIQDLLLLTAEIFAGGFLLYWISTRLLQDREKGGIFTSLVLFVILFFGVFQDFFDRIESLVALSYLRLLVLVCFLSMGVLFIYLKRTKANFRKTTLYINILLIIYLVIDLGTILVLLIVPVSSTGKSFAHFKFPECTGCKTPSIYLIVLDGYFGSKGLREYFDYNNVSFEEFLRGKGFKVIQNTSSNYQLTLFSMASMLNMNYIPDLKEQNIDEHYTYKRILSILKNNSVCEIFQENGYRLVNFSDFELKNAPSKNFANVLPQKIELITSQTMIHRVRRFMPVWLAQMKIIKYQKQIESSIVEANEDAMSKTLAEGPKRDSTPAFVYVHLMMPHPPYAFDSSGNRNSVFDHTTLSDEESDKGYLQYLVYTNQRISKFITELQDRTNKNSIILLMSDHGYRDAKKNDFRFSYQTLNAVFLPESKNDYWYDGMTNVNQFRILFNAVFGQNLALLKDSIVHQKAK